ncbi:putative ATP-dependent RNA helicase TDRD12 [Pogona vitticeps]
MLEVFILKIENPNCFWVGIKGGGTFIIDEIEYKKLQSEMNQFYNKTYRYADEVKPPTLEEGQVCVVYCQELKSWCRAVVKSIKSHKDYYITECFLVDYAQIVHVKTDRICVALESFMRLPYRAKKFQLYCTKPVTLRVNYYTNKVETVPVDRWDIAAIQYFQDLLHVTTQVEAKLCAFKEDSFDVYLYVTIKGEKVCVNDDLVAKNYACYEINSKTNSTVENENEKTPLSIESASEEINPAYVLWPKLLQAKKPKVFDMSGDLSDGCQRTSCKPSQENDSYNRDVILTIPPLIQGVTVSVQGDLPTGQKTTEMQQMEKDLSEKNPGVKLLQFLNPDPLKAADQQDEREALLSVCQLCPVVLSNKIEPCSSLEMAPLFLALKKELLKNQFQGPNHTQSYSWPAIARGYDSVIISPEKDPLVYLLPIITFLQSRSCYISLPARNGPVALILCPGQKKAEWVFQFLENYSYCSRSLHPVLLLLGKNKEEIKSVRIPRGCEIIVTTPHSLLRLLEYQCLLFLRLCHLVLDEADVLFSEDSDQIFKILECYKTNLSVEGKESAPQQIVAVGTHWNKNIDYLMEEFMNDPYVVITSLQEAAIYGKVQQVVQLCLECNRMSALLQILDFTPMDAQKTLIFTRSVEEMEVVHKAVESSSIFCLKMNSEIGFDFSNVVDQWNKQFNSGTNVVLVLTDDYTAALGITDATCVIHFSFPASPRIFGARLYNMSANFQNSIKKVLSGKEQPKAKSILLLTEHNACQAVGVLNYLKRAEATIPSELFDLTSGVLEAREESKSERPLCHHLKKHGFCKNKKCCPDRHRISLEADLPGKVSDVAVSTGNVTILPLFIVDATTYFGRIVDKEKDVYTAFAEEMNLYYKTASNCISAETVEKLTVYALQEENTFHRVQVLEVMPKEKSCMFHNVHIRYIDEGRTGQVQSYRLLLLPEPFQLLPPQAVEFIICRVKPIDNEVEWNPKVTRYINNKIRGIPHEAKIVLALKNTVWLDPVVRVTRLLDLKTCINEYNIRSEILSTGLGVDNPKHIPELQKLLRDAETIHKKGDLPALIHPLSCGTGEKATPISPQRILEHTINASHNLEEQVPSSGHNEQERDTLTADGHSQVTLQNHCNLRSKADESPQPSCKRFHPTIKWFEKEDVVVLKIKLQNIFCYDCKFFKQRIVFSASAEGKFYLADMELQGSILKEKSACILKNEEPVITLAKEKTGPWCSLLKHKNPHVSFDFDYLEDCEERSPIFVDIAPTKIRQCVTVVCEEELESLDESDTESDLSS